MKARSKPTRVSHPIHHLLPTENTGFDALAELALDMRWSWNHATDNVWRRLDPVLWDLTHHPYDVLQTVSREKVKELLADPVFRKEIDGHKGCAHSRERHRMRHMGIKHEGKDHRHDRSQ